MQALAVAGLSVVGRDYYGVFPLRGKLLNVRDASPTQVYVRDRAGVLGGMSKLN
jgi:DNA gyrase/topoisomerase IV subunit B